MGRNVSQYLNYASSSNIATLERIKSTYTDRIGAAITELDKADFSTWDDSVSAKLSSHCSDMKTTYLNAISNEVSTGNLATLIKLVRNLKSKCEEYQKWDAKSYSLNLSDEDKAFYNSGQESSMSQSGKYRLSAYRSNLKTKRETLGTVSDEIDQILADIQALEFSKTGIATDGITVDYTPVEAPESQAGIVSQTVIAEYDDLNGAHVVVTETVETTEDGLTITTLTEEITYPGDAGTVTNTTSVTQDPNDPSVGVVETAEGSVITAVRDPETGEIVETESSPAKNDSRSESTTSFEDYVVTIEITNPDGTVETREVNANSTVEYTQLWMYYQTQLVSNGFTMNSDIGMTQLMLGGEASITNPQTGDTIYFRLK